MAEDKPERKKRVIKNPETFRERAAKAAEADAKPGRSSQVTGGVKTASRTVWGPFGSFFRKLFNLKIFAWLKKPLRFIGRILLPRYIRNSWKELKLVTWPNWKQSRQLTFAVLVFAIVFGAAVALVDYGLDKIFKHLLLK